MDQELDLLDTIKQHRKMLRHFNTHIHEAEFDEDSVFDLDLPPDVFEIDKTLLKTWGTHAKSAF